MNDYVSPTGVEATLDGLNYAELTAIAAAATAKANAQRAPFLEGLRQQIQGMCGAAGVTVAELFQFETPAPVPVRKPRGPSTAPAKYRSGTNTWTGRGKRPTWLKEAINGGAKLEDFLITAEG